MTRLLKRYGPQGFVISCLLLLGTFWMGRGSDPVGRDPVGSRPLQGRPTRPPEPGRLNSPSSSDPFLGGMGGQAH